MIETYRFWEYFWLQAFVLWSSVWVCVATLCVGGAGFHFWKKGKIKIIDGEGICFIGRVEARRDHEAEKS